MEEFAKDFEMLPLNAVYAVEEVSDKVELLNMMILDCINRHAPLKRVKLTRPPSPWMKELNITQLQHQRNRQRTLVKRNPTEENKNSLRLIRNCLKKESKKNKI